VIQRTLSVKSGGVIELVARYSGSRQFPVSLVIWRLFPPSILISQMFQCSLRLCLPANTTCFPSNDTDGSEAAANSGVRTVSSPEDARRQIRLPLAAARSRRKAGGLFPWAACLYGTWVKTKLFPMSSDPASAMARAPSASKTTPISTGPDFIVPQPSQAGLPSIP
jgi:hypothetical protein